MPCVFRDGEKIGITIMPMVRFSYCCLLLACTEYEIKADPADPVPGDDTDWVGDTGPVGTCDDFPTTLGGRAAGGFRLFE